MSDSGLGPNHRNHILQLMLAIHREMMELEASMAIASKPTPFSRLINDISPVEIRSIQDHFARIRQALHTNLQELGIPLQVQKSSLRWILGTSLMHLQVLVDDLSPRSLSAYGPVGGDGADSVVRVQADLRRLLEQIQALVHKESGQDLEQRLARLQSYSVDASVLAKLQEVVSRWGLVEFGPVIEQIVARLENPRFEIAFFGRVSSGKSSLINHLTGFDVLPVGVTPVTAVPTRITAGTSCSAVVCFTDAPAITISVERLQDYVAEVGNRGNRKHVTDVLVKLSSARLQEGVVLVDTPGIGSLASEGAAEAIAYLPKCDLGVVLIDAASTLNQEDLALVRSLYEAGVPAMVLLSKADLLSPSDRARVVEYAQSQLDTQLGLGLPVQPVSTVGEHESLLLSWFESHVRPLMSNHRSLAEASIKRKTGAIQESVAASLRVLRDRQKRTELKHHQDSESSRVKTLLESAESAIREASQQCLSWGDVRDVLLDYAIEQSARKVVSIDGGDRASGDSLLDSTLKRIIVRRGADARSVALRLWEKLVSTLERLAESNSPFTAGIDASGLREAKPAELPIPQVPGFEDASLRRPIWAGFAGTLAAHSLASRIERKHGVRIRGTLNLEDRRLQNWLEATLEGMRALYESQASTARERLRRLTDPMARESGNNESVEAQLIADIAALSQTEQPKCLESSDLPGAMQIA